METNVRVKEIYKDYANQDFEKINSKFVYLLIGEWFFSLAVSYFFHSQSTSLVTVGYSLFFITVISLLTITGLWYNPNSSKNKYYVAGSQFFYYVFLGLSTQGNISSQYFIFGALAFISIYKDIKLILTVTGLIALDHVLRIYFFSNSFYGLVPNFSFQKLDFLLWIGFENIFLMYSIKLVKDRTKELAIKQYELENSLSMVEHKVEERTEELKKSQEVVTAQQQSLVFASKMSALGEMAGGIAHEINTPLAVIQLRTDQLNHMLESDPIDFTKIKGSVDSIDSTVRRITKTINGLRSFSRDSRNDPPVICALTKIVEDSLSLCVEKIKNKGISVEYERDSEISVLCNQTELTQVVLNLLSNSVDAIEDLDQKWIKIEFKEKGDWVECIHTDSGSGVPDSIKEKIMQPFFTTKETGKGTGLGLSISQGIIKNHRGHLVLDDQCKNTRFVVSIPKNYLGEVRSA